MPDSHFFGHIQKMRNLRWLNSLSSVCLLASSLLSIDAATDLSGGNGTGVPGGTATLSVNLSTTADLVGIQLELVYDASVLNLLTIGPGSALGHDHVVDSAVIDSGIHRLLVYSDDNLAIGDGELVVVNFDILPGAALGTTTISLASVVLGDPSANLVTVDSLDDGDVTVSGGVVEIVGRYLFYNDSSFDQTRDSDAIAPDKQALLAGGQATFSNYSNYSKGINGVIVDIANLANPAGLGLSDFDFRTGNVDDTAAWTGAPEPSEFSVDQGAGVAGSDRVVMGWANNNLDGIADSNEAVASAWLEVTVKGTSNTGLGADSRFYYGNAPGDVGNNSGVDANVTLNDVFSVFSNQQANAGISSERDFNRDNSVTLRDVFFAFGHQVAAPVALVPIDLSGSGGSSLMRSQLEAPEFMDRAGLIRMLSGSLDLFEVGDGHEELDLDEPPRRIAIDRTSVDSDGPPLSFRIVGPPGRGKLLYTSEIGGEWEPVPVNWLDEIETGILQVNLPPGATLGNLFFRFETNAEISR